MKIQLERVPTGIKYLNDENMPKDFDTIKNPKVRSFCDAIQLLREEEFNKGIIVTQNTIKVCKWSPVSLGLKEPETGLEKNINPLFDELNHGVFVFNTTITANNHPLQKFVAKPDVVTLVANKENSAKVVEAVGLENFTLDFSDQLEFSAISEYTPETTANLSKKERRKRARRLRNIKSINWLFASKLISNKLMIKIITWMMKGYPVSLIFDVLTRKFYSGMACCYSVSAIPHITQKGNISFVDTGSIGWGELSNKYLLIGLPYSLYKKLESKLEFPS
ncbi:MAG: DUF169 domain-containing protein [Candidatus Heimdallarchaeota archaeon]